MRFHISPSAADPRDPHLPHNHTHNSASTRHARNDTTVGWLRARTEESARGDEGLRRERANCLKYLDTDGAEIHWDFIRAAHASVADISIVPLQDVLGLGSDARMNTPASTEGNWAWRFREGALTNELRDRLREMTETYGRLPSQ